MPAAQFMELPNKHFDISELQNLLSSTSHYHQLYALRLIGTCLSKCEGSSRDFVYKHVLNKEETNLMTLVDMSLQMNQQRSGFLEQFVLIFNSIFAHVFDHPDLPLI
mmetsp:Transcript_5840/g.9978  ORF Transcript_5840/g.9978 Transcript_5840/m.9978 type:complete len:107 (+) Transcript_5840:667-987(+)